MFHDIPQNVLDRMAYLETRDRRDREDGTSKAQRLRQIPAETGKVLAVMAASAPEGALLEIGTSGGYSALWLSLACRVRQDYLTTFELSAEKILLAQETFRAAGVADLIRLVEGDARLLLKDYPEIAFCFLDAEKEIYTECYELVVPRLKTGGIFLADNVISHQDQLEVFLNRAVSDPRVDAVTTPVGKGLLVCRKA